MKYFQTTIDVNRRSDQEDKWNALINGVAVDLPYNDGFVDLKQRTSVFMIVQGHQFSVAYNGYQIVYITLNPDYQHQVYVHN